MVNLCESRVKVVSVLQKSTNVAEIINRNDKILCVNKCTESEKFSVVNHWTLDICGKPRFYIS